MTKQMATIINELAKYSQTAGYVYKTEDSVYTANGYAIIIEAHTDNVLAVVYDKATDSLYKSVLTMLQAAKELGVPVRWGADWDNDGKPRERGESDSPHFEI